VRAEGADMQTDARAAWDAELDAFEARVVAVEAALAAGDWEPARPWTPPVHLETVRPDVDQVVRVRALAARADAARLALREALADVGNELGAARRQRSAARSYLRADVNR
jgi:hypothetical protein